MAIDDQPLLDNPSPQAVLFAKYFPIRYRCILLALLQNASAAGIFYGWSALSALLINSGAFDSLCNDGNCEPQRKKLHYIYSFAQSANLLGSLISGFFLDWLGPRVCSVLSIAGVSIGIAMLGVSNYMNMDSLIFPAMLMIGFWGPGVQVPLFHMANIFPNNAGSVMYMISGAFNLGFLIFLLFRILNDAIGLSLSFICLVYTVFLIMLMIGSIMMWSDTPIEREEIVMDDLSEADTSWRNVINAIFSVKFILLLVWMATSVFWANFYIGTVGDQLVKEFPEVDAKSLSYIFNILLPIGTLGIPLYGRLTEKGGFHSTFSIGCLTATAYALLANVYVRNVQIIAFILYSVFRTMLFSSVFVYVGSEWGFQSFGVLTGVLFLISSLVGLTQYYVVRAFNADYILLNVIQAMCFAVVLVFPVYLYLHERSKRRTKTVSFVVLTLENSIFEEEQELLYDEKRNNNESP